MEEFVDQSHRMDDQLDPPMARHIQTHDPDDTAGHEDPSAAELARIPHSSTAMVDQAAATIAPTVLAKGEGVVGYVEGLAALDLRRWSR
jgi:hypothetical protein